MGQSAVLVEVQVHSVTLLVVVFSMANSFHDRLVGFAKTTEAKGPGLAALRPGFGS